MNSIKAEKVEDDEVKFLKVKAEKVEDEDGKYRKVKAEKIEDEEVKFLKVKAAKVKAVKVEDEEVKHKKVKAAKVKAVKVEDEEVKHKKVKAEKIENEEVKVLKVKAVKVRDKKVKAVKVTDKKVKAEKVVGTSQPQNIYAMGESSSDPLANDFEALFNNPRFSDVTLKAGDREFSAHKLVLSSRSKVFEAMFQHDMQENRQDTVDLATMEVDTVKDMLRYIYCGKVRRLTPGDALRLYAAADRYDLRELVHHCRAIMLSGLSIDNICEVSSVADLHHDQTLMDAVKELLAENTKQVLKTDKWQEFAKENPSLVLNLIHAVILNN
ncbi:TD and POZ domain-containing protein 4-like [Uloborus diversus]|uniref:TD and POZ domain-containing protein 4-like n=1 Tax=Uloborus diversus TaxID=327109 RepID=UPI00240A8BEC|nr:TD and POZ domain-containing protein 4-like [Uloborus diversus]